MLGDEKKLDPGDLFHVFNLEQLIPADHILRRIDAVLDTAWVRDEVAGTVPGPTLLAFSERLYCHNGNCGG